MVCLLCSVFKGLSRCFVSNSYIISSSYDVCQQNVLKSFLLFYINDIVLTTWISYHLTWTIVNKNLKFLFYLIVVLNKQPVYITPYRKPCQRYSNILFNLFADVYWKVYLTVFLRVCIWSSPCIFSYIPSNAKIPSHVEWLLFAVNFYIIFRFNQLFLQNFRQKNILSFTISYAFWSINSLIVKFCH